MKANLISNLIPEIEEKLEIRSDMRKGLVRLNQVRDRQGGIIPGNQGTRFPGNPNVSQEILIVNPVHLSRKWNARIRRPKLHKKTVLLVIGGTFRIT